MGAPAKNPSPTKPQSSATTDTTPPTIYKAAHAVLNTNELLCEIISHLPLESIVATTGVCKTWRAALKASAAIQQALFLAPTNISRITTTKADFPKRVEAIPGERYVPRGHRGSAPVPRQDLWPGVVEFRPSPQNQPLPSQRNDTKRTLRAPSRSLAEHAHDTAADLSR